MTKRQLIDRILQLNRTASAGFLAQFAPEELHEYLAKLCRAYQLPAPEPPSASAEGPDRWGCYVGEKPWEDGEERPDGFPLLEYLRELQDGPEAAAEPRGVLSSV